MLNKDYAAAVVEMQNRHNLNHPGGSMHGSVYFKLLDDAAWFTAQALVFDNFIFTTSFTSYITRPVPTGTNLIATGSIINATKTLIIAESKIVDKNSGKLVATGSGTFMRGHVPLTDIKAYVQG